jgi:membrane fusion protein (multidrug efflux system)
MQMKNKTVIIILGCVVIVFLLALPKILSFDVATQGQGGDEQPQDSRVPVTFQVVERQKLAQEVHTVGTILSYEEIEVRCEISGKIDKIYFLEGGKIKKGGRLLEINDDEMQAQLVTATYRAELAEQQAARQRQLFEKKLASQQEYDTAVANLNVAKGQVQLLRTQIEKTDIRAQFDGIVGLRFVSEGSYVSPSTVITTLQNSDSVKIDFTFPEKYAAEVIAGNRITFSTQGSSNEYTGTIYAIPPRIDPETRTLRIRAISPNTDGALIPGAFANVKVLLQERQELLIPTYALIPELKGHKVLLMQGGKAAMQAVEIGRRTEEHVQITQGLSAGDTLITSGILQLRPGMPVRAIPKT